MSIDTVSIDSDEVLCRKVAITSNSNLLDLPY
jgi:hypothetical protein